MGPTTPNSPNMGYGPMPNYQPAYSTGPSPRRKKLAIFFVVGALLLVMFIVISILSNRKDPAQEAMVNLYIAQNEMLRVSKEQGKKLNSSTVKRHNAELDATITTNSLRVKAELRRAYGIKSISAKEQKAAIDKKSDELLASSAKLNRLDEEYADIVSQKLARQIELANQAQGTAKDKTTKTALTSIATSTTELRNRFTSTPSDSAETSNTSQP